MIERLPDQKPRSKDFIFPDGQALPLQSRVHAVFSHVPFSPEAALDATSLTRIIDPTGQITKQRRANTYNTLQIGRRELEKGVTWRLTIANPDRLRSEEARYFLEVPANGTNHQEPGGKRGANNLADRATVLGVLARYEKVVVGADGWVEMSDEDMQRQAIKAVEMPLAENNGEGGDEFDEKRVMEYLIEVKGWGKLDADQVLDNLQRLSAEEKVVIWEETKAWEDSIVSSGPEDVDNSVSMYFREISRNPLLTAEEEVDLAKKLKEGLAAAYKLAKDQVKSATEETELYQVVVTGEAARTTLIESNLRLVVSVARKYLGKGMPISDLIQEGNKGLEKGTEKFDPGRGYRFSTYNYWWIRQAITKAISDQSRTIRVPVHMVELAGDVFKAYRELQQELKREPSHEEVGGRLGMPADRVKEIIQVIDQPVSLQTPIGEEQEQTLANLIPNPAAVNPAEAVEGSDLKGHVSQVLDELTPRERMVLILRFGLDDGKDRTLGEVGQELGVSRERARQIEAVALHKLRHPTLRSRLLEYSGV